MSFLAAVEREMDLNLTWVLKQQRLHCLGPSFFLAHKIRKFPKGARKRRTLNKWCNALLKRYGEWY